MHINSSDITDIPDASSARSVDPDQHRGESLTLHYVEYSRYLSRTSMKRFIISMFLIKNAPQVWSSLYSVLLFALV